MISEIRIRNFKSIEDLSLKLGRVTVLIGENGSGKSNILESIAFAAGAAANKLDNEFLFNRGIRVTESKWMQSAFPPDSHETPIKKQKSIQFSFKTSGGSPDFQCQVKPVARGQDGNFARWKMIPAVNPEVLQTEVQAALKDEAFAQKVNAVAERALARAPGELAKLLKSDTGKIRKQIHDGIRNAIALSELTERQAIRFREVAARLGLADFVIYAPENTVLRTPPPESAIQPLGTKGEGLFRLLQSFTHPEHVEQLNDLKRRLHLFGWFDDFQPPDDETTSQARLRIRDRWLTSENAFFDQRSANEGFLYVLFYFTLMMSQHTPRFFGLDNVDNALNPKLCAALMLHLAELAAKYDKQVICTTHNPAILDGLNLKNDEQRLLTVRRDSDGHTVVNRVQAPKPQPGEPPIKLSEAFLSGLIGGLPEHF